MIKLNRIRFSFRKGLLSHEYEHAHPLAANGRPAGFNVAMMSEIGRQLNIRFEFVPVESTARFAALASRKIDVIFFNFMTEQMPDILKVDTDRWNLTNPYYEYSGGYFLVKK